METPTGHTATEVVDGLHDARDREHQAAVDQVELAVAWALLHPHDPSEGSDPAAWTPPAAPLIAGRVIGVDGDHCAPLAGPGTPLVDEFAPAALGAHLGISLNAARELIGESLELRFRLPRLWELVVAGRLPVWRARQIAGRTMDLCVQAVAFADRLLCAVPDKIGKVNAEKLVDEARLYFDPDRAAEDERHQLNTRGVHLSNRGTAPATTDVFMTLDTVDAELFDQTVSRIAQILADLGDPDDLDIRRARAAGILADPQYALDMMSGRDDATPTPGGAGIGNLDLFVHLTPEDLNPLTDQGEDSAGTGAVSIERLGAATTELIAEWMTRYAAAGGKVILRPVIDLNAPDDQTRSTGTGPVDQHDPPTALRELCILRDATCVFPGCTRDSRSCDLDHIVPYIKLEDGGPPGQTRADNLAPLCRTHHRVKTHTGWDYKRLETGTYAWTSPTGHQYTVRPASRRPPDRPTRRG